MNQVAVRFNFPRMASLLPLVVYILPETELKRSLVHALEHSPLYRLMHRTDEDVDLPQGMDVPQCGEVYPVPGVSERAQLCNGSKVKILLRRHACGSATLH